MIKKLFWIFLLVAGASVLHAGQLTIAAASDLKFALDEGVAAFRASHPEVEVKVSYGSSGSLCAQIQNGAPYDLFLAADRKFPESLIAGGQAVADSLFPYAIGHLVVWVLNDSKIDVQALGIQSLNDAAAKKVAIANPEFAPYGRAAAAAMQSLGVYEQVKPRLVLGENIAQTAQFVESGAADIGIISLSLAVAPVMASKGRFWKVPVDSYPKMEQAGIILNHAANPNEARLFVAFLQSEAGHQILKKFGFLLPREA